MQIIVNQSLYTLIGIAVLVFLTLLSARTGMLS
jgi:hypothetical protein